MLSRFVSRRARVAIVTGAALTAIVSFEACLEPTQVTLVIEADERTCLALKNIAVVVRGDAVAAEDNVERKEYSTKTDKRCTGGGHIGTIVVTPPDKRGSAAIAIVAGVGATGAESCGPKNGYLGCIVARRNVTFVEHTPLVLPVRLTFDCLNVPCDAASTCSNRGCVSSTSECQGSDCTNVDPTPVEASTANDGSSASCTLRNQPRACPPYTNGSPCGAPPDTCCAIGGSYGYGSSSGGSGGSGFVCNAACGYFRLECAGQENCADGESCCVAGMQTVCRAGACSPQAQACVTDCECPSGTACLPGGVFPSTVKTCRPR